MSPPLQVHHHIKNPTCPNKSNVILRPSNLFTHSGYERRINELEEEKQMESQLRKQLQEQMQQMLQKPAPVEEDDKIVKLEAELAKLRELTKTQEEKLKAMLKKSLGNSEFSLFINSNKDLAVAVLQIRMTSKHSLFNYLKKKWHDLNRFVVLVTKSNVRR